MKKTKTLVGVLTLALAAGSAVAQPDVCANKVQIQSQFAIHKVVVPLTRGDESSIPKPLRDGITIKFSAPMFLCFGADGKFSGISYVQPPIGYDLKVPTPADWVWDWAGAGELSAAGYGLSDWSLFGHHLYALSGPRGRAGFGDGTAYMALYGISINHWYQRELKQQQDAEAKDRARWARKALPRPSKISFD
ncbi:MAG TPA: hypothetical protein VNH15_04070 [Elusimicrobiota bacterium]|nr:hypothetical protein [Elusimicrobiota bacterium]